AGSIPAASTTNTKGHPLGWPFLLVLDMTGIEAAAGTDAGRRQGFGKRACRCLSGFRLQAKTREIPSAPRNEGRFVWRFNGPAQSSEAKKQQLPRIRCVFQAFSHFLPTVFA
ncbi:hypothetical protein, partial [Collimonas fungivorans]|uniref:hypothetical protein n=1 Tax=Collimonas fungivorans TaxID=158899 RepID=UPI003FA36ABB